MNCSTCPKLLSNIKHYYDRQTIHFSKSLCQIIQCYYTFWQNIYLWPTSFPGFYIDLVPKCMYKIQKMGFKLKTYLRTPRTLVLYPHFSNFWNPNCTAAKSTLFYIESDTQTDACDTAVVTSLQAQCGGEIEQPTLLMTNALYTGQALIITHHELLPCLLKA